MNQGLTVLVASEDEIEDILKINKRISSERELQSYLAKSYAEFLLNRGCLKKRSNLIFIEPWSFEKEVKPFRRKHDLVFLNIEEFPPIFLLIETKFKPAKPNDPFGYLEEAIERVNLWKDFGVPNIKPLSVACAPKELQDSPLLPAYCAVFSFLKQVGAKKDYDEIWRDTETLDKKKILGIFDDEDIAELSYNELREELRRRDLPTSGRRTTLEKRLKESQETLEESEEGEEITCLDIIVESQDWCLRNGIEKIRLYQTKEEYEVSIIIIPPNFPEIIFHLFQASYGPGGSKYKFWNTEYNRDQEDQPISSDDLANRMIFTPTEAKSQLIGLRIVTVSPNAEEYSDTLTSVIFYLNEYCNSWKLLTKMKLD